MALLLSIHTDIMIFRIFFTLGFMLAIDLYAYQAFKTVFRSSATPYVYWGITIAYVVFSITLAAMMTSGESGIPLPQLAHGRLYPASRT